MGMVRNRGRVELVAGLILCVALVAGWGLEQLLIDPNGGPSLAPGWLPIAAAAIAAAGLLLSRPAARPPRIRSGLLWTGLLLMVWAANGLPFDLLTTAGLIGRRAANGDIVMATTWWPGLLTRALALAVAILLVRRTLAAPAAPTSAPRLAGAYGYAAFALALPYPVMRVHWALGGTLGLSRPGAGGEGWEPLLIAIPWILAAVLSLLLASPRGWIPRRLLLTAGWSATAIVSTIGPAAVWSLVNAVASGDEIGSGGVAGWVFALFYVSWFLWMIAGAAATRAYQAQTAVTAPPMAIARPSRRSHALSRPAPRA